MFKLKIISSLALGIVLFFSCAKDALIDENSSNSHANTEVRKPPSFPVVDIIPFCHPSHGPMIELFGFNDGSGNSPCYHYYVWEITGPNSYNYIDAWSKAADDDHVYIGQPPSPLSCTSFYDLRDCSLLDENTDYLIKVSTTINNGSGLVPGDINSVINYTVPTVPDCDC